MTRFEPGPNLDFLINRRPLGTTGKRIEAEPHFARLSYTKEAYSGISIPLYEEFLECRQEISIRFDRHRTRVE